MYGYMLINATFDQFFVELSFIPLLHPINDIKQQNTRTLIRFLILAGLNLELSLLTSGQRFNEVI